VLDGLPTRPPSPCSSTVPTLDSDDESMSELDDEVWEELERGEVRYSWDERKSVSPPPPYPPLLPSALPPPSLPPSPTSPAPLFYEIRTQDPDPCGYSDAHSFRLRKHGDSLLSPPHVPGSLPPPPGHPEWCRTHGAPLIRAGYSTTFMGEFDNHPLRRWDNQLLPHVPGARELPEALSNINDPFLHAENILRTTVVTPEDWEGTPDSLFRKAVRARVDSALKDWRDPSRRPTTYKRYSAVMHHSWDKDSWTFHDPPSDWPHQPLGRSDIDTHLTDDFSTPYDNDDDAIAFNPWNPQILDLRLFRYHFEEGLRNLAKHLLTPAMRGFLDGFPPDDDTRHFFYHHCSPFRYLNPSQPVHTQGFSCDCKHFDRQSTTFPHPPRRTLSPHNPLISVEEDELLHHASYIYEALGQVELVNTLRRVRDLIPFMADDAFLLFDAGYLTPMSQFDCRGEQYPILWDPPQLRL